MKRIYSSIGLKTYETEAIKMMKNIGRISVCDQVSHYLAEKYPNMFDVLPSSQFIMYHDGMVEDAHVVNISPDRNIIYDFTGDQYFVGSNVPEIDDVKCWVYKKIEGTSFYMSVNHEITSNSFVLSVKEELRDIGGPFKISQKSGVRIIDN